MLWTILTATALAQGGGVVVGNFGVQYVTSAPAGSCSQNAAMQVVLGLGTGYTCQSNTWAQVGAGGTVTPGAPDTSVQFNDGGAFAGATGLLWLKGAQQLYLVGGTANIYVESADTNSFSQIQPTHITSSVLSAGGSGFINVTGIATGSGTSIPGALT